MRLLGVCPRGACYRDAGRQYRGESWLGRVRKDVSAVMKYRICRKVNTLAYPVKIAIMLLQLFARLVVYFETFHTSITHRHEKFTTIFSAELSTSRLMSSRDSLQERCGSDLRRRQYANVPKIFLRSSSPLQRHVAILRGLDSLHSQPDDSSFKL